MNIHPNIRLVGIAGQIRIDNTTKFTTSPKIPSQNIKINNLAVNVLDTTKPVICFIKSESKSMKLGTMNRISFF